MKMYHPIYLLLYAITLIVLVNSEGLMNGLILFFMYLWFLFVMVAVGRALEEYFNPGTTQFRNYIWKNMTTRIIDGKKVSFLVCEDKAFMIADETVKFIERGCDV